jgi:hypothetical protein
MVIEGALVMVRVNLLGLTAGNHRTNTVLHSRRPLPVAKKAKPHHGDGVLQE